MTSQKNLLYSKQIFLGFLHAVAKKIDFLNFKFTLGIKAMKRISVSFFKAAIASLVIAGSTTSLYSKFEDITHLFPQPHHQKAFAAMTINGGMGDKIVFMLSLENYEVQVFRMDFANRLTNITATCGIACDDLIGVDCIKTGINKDSEFFLVSYKNQPLKLFYWHQDRFIDCSQDPEFSPQEIIFNWDTFNYDPVSRLVALFIFNRFNDFCKIKLIKKCDKFHYSESVKGFLSALVLEDAKSIVFNNHLANPLALVIYNGKNSELIRFDLNYRGVYALITCSGLELGILRGAHIITPSLGLHYIYVVTPAHQLRCLLFNEHAQTVEDITLNCGLEGNDGTEIQEMIFAGHSCDQVVCIRYQRYGDDEVMKDVRLFRWVNGIFQKIVLPSKFHFINAQWIEIVQDAHGVMLFVQGSGCNAQFKVFYDPEIIYTHGSTQGVKSSRSLLLLD